MVMTKEEFIQQAALKLIEHPEPGVMMMDVARMAKTLADYLY